MGDVTKLLEDAAKGDCKAWDELYRRIEPELRKLALHWIRRYYAKKRVRTTEVIDRAFVKLMQIPSPGWQHRGAFYVFACRSLWSADTDYLLVKEKDLERAVKALRGQGHNIR